MRSIGIILVVLLSPIVLQSQEKEVWQRVYTFDDGLIEINTSKVTFGSKNIGRVRFRTTLAKPEALRGTPSVSYKSRLETVEFDCLGRRYRPYEETLVDVEGRVIRSVEVNPPAEWIIVKSGGMMEKLFAPACKLIELKRRSP